CGINESLRMPTGGSVEASRDAFVEILNGAPTPAAEIVALNAAVVFCVIGAETQLPAAFERARSLLKSGAAWRTFERAKETAIHG
ncbi:MAG: hypothetical protein WBX23_13525, partial [Candidatus Cybelea sp.]